MTLLLIYYFVFVVAGCVAALLIFSVFNFIYKWIIIDLIHKLTQ